MMMMMTTRPTNEGVVQRNFVREGLCPEYYIQGRFSPTLAFDATDQWALNE